ncbi:hypothetical protein AB0H45_18545 [Streptomyces atroolivaceus]|uniref:hypothetical protein n=1 Tax=Streptomyces atroolivaceus TaxID=66869 RepID=UPI003402741B
MPQRIRDSNADCDDPGTARLHLARDRSVDREPHDPRLDRLIDDLDAWPAEREGDGDRAGHLDPVSSRIYETTPARQRTPDGPAHRAARRRTAVHDDRTAPGAEAPWRLRLQPDPTLLFRLSALTATAHLIHHDAPYCRDTEGHPGLVVLARSTEPVTARMTCPGGDPRAVPSSLVDQRTASDAVHRKAEGRPRTGCIRAFRQRGEGQ